MEFEKIIPIVVLCLYFASRVSEARILSDEEDLELERQLKLINKPPVKSFQVLDFFFFFETKGIGVINKVKTATKIYNNNG